YKYKYNNADYYKHYNKHYNANHYQQYNKYNNQYDEHNYFN
uniref:Uncharacterized protein n=1 Tax=Plectus sambesii TaxID=2011161 RepID=A0A914WAF5_9BILA